MFLLLALFAPLTDTGRGDPATKYNQTLDLFLHGHLEESQKEAERGYRLFASNPLWAPRFHLLEAQSMVWRGIYTSALPILESTSSQRDPDDQITALTLEGVAFTHLHRLREADQKLSQAESLCAERVSSACGGVVRARGILSLEHGDNERAQQFFTASLSFARAHHDKPLETTALLNLGRVYLQEEHYDEAVDLNMAAYRSGLELGDENRVQGALGNLGWAYFGLGDMDRALSLFLDAENRAASLGNIREEIKWLTTAADVYHARDNTAQATEFYRRSLVLARQIKSEEDIVNALEELTHASIDAGNLADAEDEVSQLEPLVHANRLDALDVIFAQARIAAARNRFQDAEALFRIVDRDPASQTSMRMGAEHELAALYEVEGQTAAADRMYRTALTTFESARNDLKNEDSKLPFLANATAIYDDYIHFLVTQGKPDAALLIADQSRAQTLAQGLGLSLTPNPGSGALRPTDVARKTDSTLLFYWLGQKQSYLWAVSANKTSLFPLPPQHEIARIATRYRKTLLGFTDPVEKPDTDGLNLYRTLVAPASSLIPSGANIVTLTDGELSQLNFETLIVPGPHPHYWIDDVTLVSAPSLHLLAAAHAAEPVSRKLLLFGDAISPNPDYPELPMATAEMKQIEQHFSLHDQTIYARERATAPAYIAANPQQFAYIHFVAHGVASRTDPLDSAIILSRANTAEDAFKLHARDIIRYPLHARLVTIAACYGSGSRSYVGEGPVGLAWAFLRAGAHNVIGALWEASDESTAQMMGDLYQGVQRGMPPAAALRSAKLNLLHSQREFRKPFYWGSFQIYNGL